MGQLGPFCLARCKPSQDRRGANCSIRRLGIGPEAALPIPLREKEVFLVQARPLRERGRRRTTEGKTFVGVRTVPASGSSIEQVTNVATPRNENGRLA